MKARLRGPLWALRLYGPCSNKELAAKLGRACQDVYRQVYELRQKGYATAGDDGYDITDKGRKWLETWSPETGPKLFS